MMLWVRVQKQDLLQVFRLMREKRMRETLTREHINAKKYLIVKIEV